MTVASGMRSTIISTIQDFKSNDIVAILSSYFNLPTDHSQDFLSNCDRLTGPPNIISFFLSASQNFHLKSFMELMGKWKDIEDFAIGSYSNQNTRDERAAMRQQHRANTTGPGTGPRHSKQRRRLMRLAHRDARAQ
jgi:hypothetical protein